MLLSLFLCIFQQMTKSLVIVTVKTDGSLVKINVETL